VPANHLQLFQDEIIQHILREVSPDLWTDGRVSHKSVAFMKQIEIQLFNQCGSLILFNIDSKILTHVKFPKPKNVVQTESPPKLLFALPAIAGAGPSLSTTSWKPKAAMSHCFDRAMCPWLPEPDVRSRSKGILIMANKP